MRPDFVAQKLSDNQLISQLKRSMSFERRMQSRMLGYLGEIERRRLYAVKGYSSMFNYVTAELGYSEASAFKRIQVARAATKFPQIYCLVEEGRISLTALLRLCPHLKVSNYEEWLSKAQKRSVKEVEKMLSESFPKPEPPDSVKPLSKDRVWFSFCGDEEFVKMVDDAKDLLRHRYPKGGLKDVFKVALSTFLNQEGKKRTAVRRKGPPQNVASSSLKVASRNDARSRYIPQHVKAAVWERDRGRCSYVSPERRRCEESGCLEFDHKLPWSLGGSSDDVNNIRLLCRAHNRLMADQLFGINYVEKKIAEKHSGFQRDLYWNRFHLELWQAGDMKRWRRVSDSSGISRKEGVECTMR